jgi:hypothetical protein
MAARGEFKLGQAILTIALFTSLIVALEASSQAYLTQVPILEEMAVKPSLSLSEMPLNDSITVDASSITLDGTPTLILASNNLTALLKLSRAAIEGRPPGDGEALLGSKLTLENLTFNGLNLRGSGRIISPEPLSSAIIVDDSTFQRLNLTRKRFYLREGDEEVSQPSAQAPSLLSLVRAVRGEALGIASSIAWILSVALALTCAAQGYSTAKGSEKTLRTLLGLEASKIGLTFDLAAVALFAASMAVALGYALGLSGLALFSSILSILYGLPYVKPLASTALIERLFFALTASSIALSVGFAGEVSTL